MTGNCHPVVSSSSSSSLVLDSTFELFEDEKRRSQDRLRNAACTLLELFTSLLSCSAVGAR
jgi:hypothetical protein